MMAVSKCQQVSGADIINKNNVESAPRSGSKTSVGDRRGGTSERNPSPARSHTNERL